MKIPVVFEGINTNPGDIKLGQIVCVNGSMGVTLACADLPERANAIAVADADVAVIGSETGNSSGNFIQVGMAPVRLEMGLSPVAGDALYLSQTEPGAATTVEPGTGRWQKAVGTVFMADGYAGSTPENSLVQALVSFGPLEAG